MIKLGIDFGTSRIGLALQIEGVEIPLYSIDHAGYRKSLLEILKEKRIETVVVGLPISMSGRYSESTMKAVSFAEKVKKMFPGNVLLVDETLTTESARKMSVEIGIEFAKVRDVFSAMQILRNESSGKAVKWEVHNNRSVCRNLPELPLGSRVLFFKPKSGLIKGIDSLDKMPGVFVEDPQVFLSFFRKGLKPVNLIDDIDFSTYDIIVIACGEALDGMVHLNSRGLQVIECSWLNG
ncbi:MAG: Holliday junction resolvase RuvX [Mesotoga sp.]|uniref:Holliday junction resolvase RuvX n=1 Tax=Mesotoga sp. TaxID=2053577 RepID=UPI003567018D